MSKQIMIVDDDDIVRRISNNALSTKYETITASSGREAVRLYDELKPDLVLMDINMPDMSGYEVFDELLAANSSVRPTVMFMTSEDDVQNEIRCFDMGAVDYIHKPFHPDVLLRRVDVILSNLERYEVLEKGAECDNLTGVYNRGTTEKKIRKHLNEKEFGTFLMIDIDNFKSINDSMGHTTGDQILKLIAGVLKSVSRSTDVVGRVGGDEFVIYYNSLIDREKVAAKCEIIQERILTSMKSVLPSVMQCNLGVSIGVCITPEGGEDYDTVFQNADRAMYNAKNDSTRKFTFYEGESDGNNGIGHGISYIDIPMTMKIIGERGHDAGAYSVTYNDFCNIYRFIQRHAERNDDKVQLVMFTLKPKKDKISSFGKKYNSGAVITEFSKAAEKALRRSDVAARIGDSQVMMLLTGTDSQNGMIAINRIISKWNLEYHSGDFDASYEMQDVCG